MDADLYKFLAAQIAIQLPAMLASWRLIVWRIQQLERRVEEHNDFNNRLTVIETKVKLQEAAHADAARALV